MFSGIIEELGEVINLQKEGSNLHIRIKSNISKELTIDQSVAHDGICLTVVDKTKEEHTVTAIDETLTKSNAGLWQVGSLINLERCLSLNSLLDGHMVQGHVDCRGIVEEIEEHDGSHIYTISYPNIFRHLLVNKGSVTVNGTSLTVISPTDDQFSVAIIPYTFEHTNFHTFKKGSIVNLEFDIIGKYINRYLEGRDKSRLT